VILQLDAWYNSILGILNLIAGVIYFYPCSGIKIKSSSTLQHVQRSEKFWQGEQNKWQRALRNFFQEQDNRGLRIYRGAFVFTFNDIAYYFTFIAKKVCKLSTRWHPPEERGSSSFDSTSFPLLVAAHTWPRGVCGCSPKFTMWGQCVCRRTPFAFSPVFVARKAVCGRQRHPYLLNWRCGAQRPRYMRRPSPLLKGTCSQKQQRATSIRRIK